MRELVMGLVVGVLVGFMIWGGVREPSGGVAPEATPAAGGTPVEPVRRAPTLEAPPMPAGPAAVSATTAPADKTPADRSAVFRGASRAELDAAFVQHKRLSDAEAAALIVRTEEAQRGKDLGSFLRLLRILGESGHPAAHAHLVALVADVEADLPERFAEIVRPFLLVTAADGAVAAAQARIEHGSANETPPWVEVVTERGSRTDIEALLNRADRRVHVQSVYEALMAKPIEEARAYLARAEALGPPKVSVEPLLGRFATAHPEAGLALLVEGIRAFDSGEERWRTLPARAYGRNLVHAYVARIDAQRWPEAAALLAGLRSEHMRLSAVNGLGYTLPARGLDAALLGDLLDQPAESLRALLDTAPAPEDAGARLRILIHLFDLFSPLLLNEKNTKALEHAASVWQGEHRAELQRVTREYRAGLTERSWR